MGEKTHTPETDAAPEINRASPFAALDENETRVLRRLLKSTRYYKKSAEEREKLLPQLLSLVKSNSGRISGEAEFAHSTAVASHRRFKASLRAYRWLIVLFIVTVIVLATAAYFITGYVLLVGKITVEGNTRYGAEEIVAASGIAVGDRLFWDGVDINEAAESIKNTFPYIGEVSIRRKLPDSVILTVTEDTATFYSDIFGQRALLSDDMRVLQLIAADNKTQNTVNTDYECIKLILPKVVSAVTGKELEFEDKNDMIGVARRAALAVMDGGIADKVSLINLSDRFNIYISYGGRYRIELGDITDIGVKLRLAQKIMQDEIYSGGNKGIIYVSDVNKPSAIIDNSVNLD